MKRLRVAVLMHEDFLPKDTIEGLSDKEIAPWKTEYDVKVGLEELGHDVRPLAVSDDLGVVRSCLSKFKPHVVFNLLEEFKANGNYMPYVLGYFELVGQKYTGCNALGLMLTHNKALIKQILKYHRVRIPDFAVYPIGRVVRERRRLTYPLFVKSTTEHGSEGISQASIVTSEQGLKDRVAFIHETLSTDAIAEEYIDGRELYVGVIGNQRLQTLPVWELIFKNLPEGAPRIATSKVKWDIKYQQKSGVTSGAAKDLSDGIHRHLAHVSKRVFRILNLSGYARMDFRLSPEGQAFLLEPNPNPQLEYGEDFAEAAHLDGLLYTELLQRIINLGRRYRQ